MRTNPSIYFCLALLAIGIGSSSCVSKCDLNPSLCETRPVELSVHKLDISGLPQTGNTLSIHIPGDLLDGTKIARLLAPLPTTPEQLQFADMPLTAENDLGDYKISLDLNLKSITAECTYYLNLFIENPKHQIVDDICKNQIKFTSDKLIWGQIPYIKQFSPMASQPTGTRGLWIYNNSTVIIQQPAKAFSNPSSHFSALTWSGLALIENKFSINDPSSDSFGYFKNSHGVVADYATNASGPDMYVASMIGAGFSLNSTNQNLTGFGQLADLATDNGSNFITAISTSGTLQAWDFPTSGRAVKSRTISNAQVKFKKVAIIKQNYRLTSETSDLIAFDSNGTAQVFLQQADGNFIYDQKLSEARADLKTGEIAALAIGDLDGDAVDDIAIVRRREISKVIFYLNNGDGSFKELTIPLDLSLTSPSFIAALAIGPIGTRSSPNLNNLVILDNNANVYIYQNQTNKTCLLKTVPCNLSPATMNAP